MYFGQLKYKSLYGLDMEENIREAAASIHKKYKKKFVWYNLYTQDSKPIIYYFVSAKPQKDFEDTTVQVILLNLLSGNYEIKGWLNGEPNNTFVIVSPERVPSEYKEKLATLQDEARRRSSRILTPKTGGASSAHTRTEQHFVHNKRKYTVYKGPRGGKYIRLHGTFTNIKSL